MVEGFGGGGGGTEGDVVVREVVVEEAGLDNAGSEVEGVGHYGCAEDAAGLVDTGGCQSRE